MSQILISLPTSPKACVNKAGVPEEIVAQLPLTRSPIMGGSQ